MYIYVYVSTFGTIWTNVGIIGVGGIYGQDVTGMLLLGVRVYNNDVFFQKSRKQIPTGQAHPFVCFSLNFFGFLEICKSPSGERQEDKSILRLENLRYQRFCRQISSINSEHFAVDKELLEIASGFLPKESHFSQVKIFQPLKNFRGFSVGWLPNNEGGIRPP